LETFALSAAALAVFGLLQRRRLPG
jgi:hypothetical protein